MTRQLASQVSNEPLIGKSDRQEGFQQLNVLGFERLITFWERKAVARPVNVHSLDLPDNCSSTEHSKIAKARFIGHRFMGF